ncbi:hypothetical protein, partial [Thioalkalivibrio sp. ALE23]|uniref:hypothetical protein n=1 Tax=Thioalkalivibrio sp. ALE23 TaxID=1265495 RepID=UPI001E5917B6
SRSLIGHNTHPLPGMKQGCLLSRYAIRRDLTTNGHKWEPFVLGLIAGRNRGDKRQWQVEFQRTIGFIGERFSAEKDIIRDCIQAQADDRTKDFLLSRVEEVFSNHLHRHTLLKREEIKSYGAAFAKGLTSRRNLDISVRADFLKGRFRLRVDFYHQLLTSLMVDMLPLRSEMGLPPRVSKALVDEGAMGRLVPRLENGKLVTPTYRLYEFWKEATGISISYRQMAQHIPSPDPRRSRSRGTACHSYNRDEDTETKKRRLKEWRDGTAPETEQLAKFLQSMFG